MSVFKLSLPLVEHKDSKGRLARWACLAVAISKHPAEEATLKGDGSRRVRMDLVSEYGDRATYTIPYAEYEQLPRAHFELESVSLSSKSAEEIEELSHEG